jgi:preprotein translocase subunit SecA
MTGTAITEAAEFAGTYDLSVVPVPTNKPMIRMDEGDLIYKSEDAKFEAVVKDLVERHEKGQPVLVGTVSVEKSERLSNLLTKRGVPHEVLNAKQHAREAEIVAQAGRLSSVTVATNMAGRGVDIILGGNPEGLAKRDLRAEGLDPDADENRPRLEQLIQKHEAETEGEGDKVRDLGGLYVLGTERHDSRRIDNQLRGRSGRQGDPGESRFYLSLEDELMRLFATGAVSWVMDKALPEDQPLTAKMVTKAIERAQTTVEQRNAEIRKNVLKYDEVMNEQRKVIYALRDQVLDQADLRQKIVEEYLPDAVNSLVEAHCVSEFSEEWDLDGLHTDIRTYWPSTLSIEQLSQATGTNELYEMLMDEALTFYEGREAELTPEVMRQVERTVMLRIIDQRWRAHLYEMDYLREGINLRAMGQKDPLVEWQREGFEMFGKMMESIDVDYVKYVMHVQVVVEEPEEPDLTKSQFTAAEDPVQSPSSLPAPPSEDPGEAPVAQAPEAPMTPIVRSEQEKVGRNDPCWCGSGQKFKHCHGS